jgi:hypothetical protein
MFDDKTFVNIFGMLYNENEHERNNAASRLYQHMKINNIHPGDVTLSIDKNTSTRLDILVEMKTRLEQAENELAYFKRQADKNTVLCAKIARNFPYRWNDVAESTKKYDFDTNRKLYKHISKICVVPISIVKKWHSGIQEIPVSQLAKIKEYVITPSLSKPLLVKKRRVIIGQTMESRAMDIIRENFPPPNIFKQSDIRRLCSDLTTTDGLRALVSSLNRKGDIKTLERDKYALNNSKHD